MKDHILNIVGMLFPGGFTILTVVEKLNPFCQLLGLIITILVGITVIVLNIKKVEKYNRDKKIDDILLRHKDDILKK